MGVKHLWSIMQPACKKEPFESMRGKVLSVDLSTWICQAEETLPLKHAVHKPYLRNTIFRVICLKRLGTRLIFATEGKPPEIKWNAILERAQARAEQEKVGGNVTANKYRKGKTKGKPSVAPAAPTRKIGRSLFQRKINECAQLLRFLGIPVVQSEGEAEACCAFLDNNQLADGCITQDGDTFLYGGRVVYRNLGISNKEPFVYKYSTDTAKEALGIDREQMVALALLLGCDYCDGVPGVGRKTALKLLDDLRGTNILERFRMWKKEKNVPESASNIEKQVFRKAMKVADFPKEEVIKEFLISRDNLEDVRSQVKWEYPDLVNIQRFCMKYMEWPEEYTLSKILGVATNEHLSRISRGIPLKCPFSANRLVKPRTKHGVPLFEVEWIVPAEKELTEFWRGYPDEFSTLESQQEILLCLPKLVEEFEKLKSEKKTKGKSGSKRKQKAQAGTGCDAESANVAAKPSEVAESAKGAFTIEGHEDGCDGASLQSTCPADLVFSKGEKRNQTSSKKEIDNLNAGDLVTSFSLLELSSFVDDVKNSDSKKFSSFRDEASAKEASIQECGKVLPLRERLQQRAFAYSEHHSSHHANEAALIQVIASKHSTAHPCSSTENPVTSVDASSARAAESRSGGKGLRQCNPFNEGSPICKSVAESGLLRPSRLCQEDKGCKDAIDFQNSQTDELFRRHNNTVLLYSASPSSHCSGKTLTDVNSPVIVDDYSTKNLNILQSTPSLPLSNILTPERHNVPSYELGNLTSDSLGCILESTSSFIGSPFEMENKENHVAAITTPSGEEYTKALRKRLGILPHDTPKTFDSGGPLSPEIEETEQERDFLPPTLMERLRKRSQRT